ncbi:MAG: hypothetical protein QOC96_2202 [Acidobacteriota bacterium]|jgi:hypothetical protein|nr:hypothetical protein [Acidobacteriota bacterium]
MKRIKPGALLILRMRRAWKISFGIGGQQPMSIRKESPIKKEVFIACPTCFSGSCFQLEQPRQEFVCDNCGFVFAEGLKWNISESEKCLFCGNECFYFEAPLDLSFLGRAAICYVCEARYKGLGIDSLDEKYTPGVAHSARRSKAALRWKERIAQHNGSANKIA